MISLYCTTTAKLPLLGNIGPCLCRGASKDSALEQHSVIALFFLGKNGSKYD